MRLSRILGPGDDAEATTGQGAVAVEEVFLEGESVVVLHHRAGSDHASRLLEDSGIHELLIREEGTD